MGEMSEAMRQVFAGRLPDLLGMEFVAVAPERTVVRLPYRRALSMPYDAMHGGAVAALADTAAGAAMAVGLSPGETFTTVEMKLNLISAVREGVATAVAVPLHRGRRTAVFEVRVHDERDRLVAIFTCTQLVNGG